MNLHLCTLLSPALELDLIPHWIKHYSRYDIDEFRIWLHTPSSTPEEISQAEELFKKAGWKTQHETDPFNPKIRYSCILPYVNTLPAADYVLYPDGDEFQAWPGNCIKSLLRGRDGFTGRLYDRFNTTIKNAAPGTPLDEQFPFEHTSIEEYFSPDTWIGLTGTIQYKWFTKICAAKARVPVSLEGLHTLLVFDKQYLLSGELKVHHFRWRQSIWNRMKGRRYTSLDRYAQAVAGFFSIDNPRQSQKKEPSQ